MVHTRIMGLKKCPLCHVEFQPKCHTQKFCSPEHRYEHWVLHNREQMNANVREYRRRRSIKEGCWRDEGPKAKAAKAFMVEIKSGPCVDCGEKFDTCCMDFDHKDGSKKRFNIGTMFAHHYSMDLIKEELAKCELVCANCHRIRTRDRRTGTIKQRNNYVAP
jgi:hypothetical protein